MATLVCEGACNPRVRALDGEVARATRFSGLHEALADVGLVADLRKLVHTTHVAAERGEHRWTCRTCGMERRWGASRFAALAEFQAQYQAMIARTRPTSTGGQS